MPDPLRIMLVDDQPMARRGFALMLRRSPNLTMTVEANNGQEALDLLAAAREEAVPLPDVILMDVRMPVLDGIETTRRITRAYPSVKVLVLTTYDEDDYAFGALTAGASGYLLKDVRTPDLIAAVEAVARGDAILTPRITRQVIERGIPRALPHDQQAEMRALLDQLTPRERDIARLIADGDSNTEIAQQLVIEPASVRRNVSRILTKLNLRDRVQIAVRWHRAGL
ncbi:response regulator transcription factor [uncultured Tessaracoccus sp.]|uniref:response regulator n=1 Tax=uncultured Tessaracoccus sp. TaxID=905023 RepID=UPI0025F478D9|nr:response regulator transcription factor [uncultured Tessaracoccus sp.]